MTIATGRRAMMSLFLVLVGAVSFRSGPAQAGPPRQGDPSITSLGPPATAGGEAARFFAATGHTVRGLFLAYWDAHGGLAQQGYPLSEAIVERNDLDGQPYTVQYFERAVFEAHPANPPPFDILLSQLGTFQYQARYPQGAPPQQVSTDHPRRFPETGHTLGGLFRTYWESHGGLAQQGYPLSDEFPEQSALNGQIYTVQYFERAVFELHPENAPPYNVLLAQLGTVRYRQKYPSSLPSPTRTAPTATPTATPRSTDTPIPTPVATGGARFVSYLRAGAPISVHGHTIYTLLGRQYLLL